MVTAPEYTTPRVKSLGSPSTDCRSRFEAKHSGRIAGNKHLKHAVFNKKFSKCESV